MIYLARGDGAAGSSNGGVNIRFRRSGWRSGRVTTGSGQLPVHIEVACWRRRYNGYTHLLTNLR